MHFRGGRREGGEIISKIEEPQSLTTEKEIS